jgi:hypothetical protein
MPGMARSRSASTLVRDVASLSHSHQIIGALWKRSGIADTMSRNLSGNCAMPQIDPWVKAAECERAIRVVADPERRSVFVSLRSLWVALGNEQPAFDRSRQSGQVPMIAQIHAELMSLYRNAMH